MHWKMQENVVNLKFHSQLAQTQIGFQTQFPLFFTSFLQFDI